MFLIDESTKDVKSVNFKNLMEELKNSPDDYDFPRRDDPKYCGDHETKGIEQLDIYQFNSCMIFEMATRNKEVIEIINKLDFIEELKDKHPYLEHEDCLLFKPIEPDFDAELQLPMLTKELRREFEAIAKMPIAKFQDELEFLVDTEYSDNYNRNWHDDMINDGIEEDDSYKITDELYKKYKHKTLQKKTIIDDEYLTCNKLNIIFEYLQNKLKNEHFIYPEGYYKGLEKSCHEEVIGKDLIDRDIFNHKEITDSINNAIKEFRALKPTHMKEIADMFFMYDYYNKRKADENLTFYAQDIKSELTKYHGIEIKSLSKKLSYIDCLDNYEELKDLEASFYTVEKTITNKIKLMKNFIDKKLYKFILLY